VTPSGACGIAFDLDDDGDVDLEDFASLGVVMFAPSGCP
jgi:hypothetical protein